MAWPDDFPTPMRSGYGLDTTSGVSRTEMEVGEARVRRRSTSPPDNITLKYLLTPTQMATFRSLWDNEFKGGSAWVVLPILTGRSVGLEYKACRPLDATFRAVPISASQWTVEFKVEVRNA